MRVYHDPDGGGELLLSIGELSLCFSVAWLGSCIVCRLNDLCIIKVAKVGQREGARNEWMEKYLLGGIAELGNGARGLRIAASSRLYFIG